MKAVGLYSFMNLGRIVGSVERSMLFTKEMEPMERKRLRVEENEKNDGVSF